MAATPDIVEFLRQYPPFAGLDAESLDVLGGAVEVEFHAAGQIIFSKGVGPVEALRVIRSGAVEVVNDGQILDLMGVGEMFGHASMLSGLPTGFEARAAEDTLTYRIPVEVASHVLNGPETLRYVTRLILEDRHHIRSGPSRESQRDQLRQPVRDVIRAAPIICSPTTTIRDAAKQMTTVGASALIVDLGSTFGIVTDGDLRSRVVASGLSGDTPLSAVMTAPAFTVSDDRPGSEVLLDMLDRGITHLPVLSASGHIVGIVEDHDLIAVESTTSFRLRHAIARASTVDELLTASSRLWPTVVKLHRGGMTALDVMSVFSIVADALTRRALDFAVEQLGAPPTRFTWLALGSQARREAVPSSDIDSAIAWFDGDGDEPSFHTYFNQVATIATETLLRCGFRPDEHRVNASDPLFVRSISSWRREANSFLDDPMQKKALVLVSVLVDSRPVWGVESEPLIAETFRVARSYPQLLHLLAQFALSHKPPVGFIRGLAIDASGEGRDRLDLKSGAVVPITDLARWAGMTAGVTCASTSARLSAASDAGTLSASDALTLRDAFELTCHLRLDHQVTQIELGVEPGDVIALRDLSLLNRSYLKEAFRAVVSVQRRVASDLSWNI